MKHEPARRASGDGPSANGRAEASPRFPWPALAGVAALAVLWRLALAAQMPCMSRDGVNFCWLAQALAERGVAALRDPTMEQHPLFPAAIAAAHRALRLAGAPESPLAWQRAGQAVAMVAGVLLIAVSGLLAAAVAGTGRREERGFVRLGDPPTAARWAFAMAAVMPLYCTISTDVLSESLHLLFYVAAAVALTHVGSFGSAAMLGLLAALAFLTRPEGGAPLAAGAVVLALRGVSERRAKPLLAAALAVAVFAAVVAPYCAAIGTLTPKLRKETVEEFVPGVAWKATLGPVASAVATGRGTTAAIRNPGNGDGGTCAGRRPFYAALTRRVLSWPEAAVESAYQLMRAGRVVVPLLAIGTLLALRGAWRRPPLVGLVLCVAVHYLLTVALLKRHGYLDARHTLPALALLLPIAAAGLAGLLADAQRRRAGLLLGAVTLATLGVYAMRVPNRHDTHLVRAAEWLRGRMRHPPSSTSNPAAGSGQAKLLGGSSQKRLAFYADLCFVPWPENEPDEARRLAELKSHVLGERPEWFAIEIDGRDRRDTEFAGNEALLRALLNDAEIAPRVAEVHRESNEIGIRLELYRLKAPDER